MCVGEFKLNIIYYLGICLFLLNVLILLKLIVKSIYPNTPNNISTSKYTKPISKISIPLQLLRLQPILARTTFVAALPHRVTVSRRTTSLDLHPPPHYLVGPRWFVLVLNFFWVLLYFDWFSCCYILISSWFGYVAILK